MTPDLPATPHLSSRATSALALVLVLLGLQLVACGNVATREARTPTTSGGTPVSPAVTGGEAPAVSSGGMVTATGGQANSGGRLGSAGGTQATGSTIGDGGVGCDNHLQITVRDFTEAHPDFESYLGPQTNGVVEELLGSDSKPVYAHAGSTQVTSGPEAFAQWYRDTPGVNERVPVSIQFDEVTPGTFVYDNSAFFPIDGQGLGNGPAGISIPGLPLGLFADHNYLFTTEVHTLFTYKGGELFRFTGDDDLWVFVNGHLGIDLGGPHSPMDAMLDIDAKASPFGLVVGNTYPMDIFHAERHTTGSNFRIETTIDFSCVINVPPLE